MDGGKKISFKPRDYQYYYLQKAKDQNVIICLGTGSGKTYISIMLFKDFGKQIRRDRKKAIFLSPTVVLAQQQSQEIMKHTNFRVKAFYGQLGVDTWTPTEWADEIDSVDILVLTPDLFHRILSKQYIDAERICVLVFDECHHAGLKVKPGSKSVLIESNSAYKRIMSFVTDKKMADQIRIVGLTASVINACHDFINLPRCVASLEDTYQARILGEFDFDPRHLAEPTISTWLFSEQVQINSEFRKLLTLSERLERALKEQKKKEESKRYKVAWNLYYLVEKPLVKPSYIVRMIRDIAHVQTELGVYSAYIVCREFREELKKNLSLVQEVDMVYLVGSTIKLLEHFEKFYLLTIQNFQERFGHETAIQRLATSKLLRLLDIIYCFNDAVSENQQDFSALIFVGRVLYAFALSNFLKHLAETKTFAYLKPSFFVGVNSEYSQFRFIKEAHKKAPKTIQDFKGRVANVLVCTSVLEEGIDIGVCNLVIRFSEPKTYREFVQSKGRARAKDSHFCIMSDRTNEIENQIKSYESIEKFLNLKFKQSKLGESVPNVPADRLMRTGEDEFFESQTGARIYLCEARHYLETYIAKKGNRNYHVDYSIEEFESGFVFRLMLQGVCPTLKDEVSSAVCLSKELAFQLACMNAIKQLYKSGQLDNQFKPISDDTVVSRCNLINREYDEGENAESRFVFNERSRKRLMFEKQLGNREYFESLVRSTGGHDLYEISFQSDDEFLKQTDRGRLSLLTKLELIPECLSTKVFGSVHDAEIKLRLIRQNVMLNREELDKIGEFTFSVFKTAVPIFKKRTDLKFDLESCLFKFAFIKPDRSIDFDQMARIVNLHERDLDADGSDNLVRAIHTNTDYRLVAYNTSVLPSDTFFFEPEKKHITYVEYYKSRYGIELRDRESTMLQVEPAGLNACYSVFCRKEESEVNENKKAKFSIFLPKELAVISTVSKSLYKKLTTVLPLTYRIKQQIILRHIAISLDREILSINDSCSQSGFGDSIFSEGSANFEPFKKRRRLSDEEQESGSQEEYDSEEESENSSAEAIDRSGLNALTEEPIRQKKDRRTFAFDEHIKHTSVRQEFLDKVLLESINSELSTTSHPNLDDALNAFTTIFQKAILPSPNALDMKSFQNSKYEDRSPVMRESDELKRLDFNHWTSGSGSVIDRARLREALTAKSAADESDLEVLEFLGDTFLKFITCCLLFHIHSDAPVGELNILKMRAVSNRNLYVLSRRKQMYRFMFGDRFLPGISYLPEGCSYTDSTKDRSTSDQSVTLVNSSGFSRSKMNLVDKNQYQELGAKSVSDGIEALIGATLNSSGFRTACLFMKFMGIYSDQFKIDANCSQANWFSTKDGRKYDPLEVDPLERKAKFTREMYEKYSFATLEHQIGYTFSNKSLLIQAFKHHSYPSLNEFPSYENLEFLGDAVIDYLIGRCIVDDPAKFTPGQLTDLKQSLINNNFFGTLAVKYGLNDYLIYSDVAIFNLIGDYKMYYTKTFRPKGDGALIIPSNYMILSEPNSINFEDVEAPKILADIFESLFAAIFLDANFDLNVVWSVLHKFLANELLKFRQCPPKTYIAHVVELFPDVRFGKARKAGELTLVDITVNGKLYTGEGPNKRQARMDASRNVLRRHLKLA